MIGIIWFSSLSTLPSDPGRRAGRILRVKEDHDVLTMKCNGKSRIIFKLDACEKLTLAESLLVPGFRPFGLLPQRAREDSTKIE